MVIYMGKGRVFAASTAAGCGCVEIVSMVAAGAVGCVAAAAVVVAAEAQVGC